MESVPPGLKIKIGPDRKPQLLFVLLEKHRTILDFRMLRIEARRFHRLPEIRLEANDLEIDNTDPSSPLKRHGKLLAIHIMYLDTASQIFLLFETNLPRKAASLSRQALTPHLKILLIVRVKNKDLGG